MYILPLRSLYIRTMIFSNDNNFSDRDVTYFLTSSNSKDFSLVVHINVML